MMRKARDLVGKSNRHWGTDPKPDDEDWLIIALPTTDAMKLKLKAEKEGVNCEEYAEAVLKAWLRGVLVRRK